MAERALYSMVAPHIFSKRWMTLPSGSRRSMVAGDLLGVFKSVLPTGRRPELPYVPAFVRPVGPGSGGGNKKTERRSCLRFRKRRVSVSDGDVSWPAF